MQKIQNVKHQLYCCPVLCSILILQLQTWILQILHESSEDLKHDVGLTTSESLIDGRILCRVVNEIASGSVKVISDVDTHESQVILLYMSHSLQRSCVRKQSIKRLFGSACMSGKWLHIAPIFYTCGVPLTLGMV